MRNLIELLTHILLTFLKLCKPGGAKALVAENIALRQQLITLSRKRNKSPKLTTKDRWIFGMVAGCIAHTRLNKIAIAIKPATILRFHRALAQRKYTHLYSNKSRKKPGRRGPSQEIIDLVIEMKQRNPRYGYRRIAMQVYQSFGINISYFSVGRILRKHHSSKPRGNSDGPSWLTFIGNVTDGLWSVDFVKCESITLQTYTVMAILDQFSRRIIGFAVHAGDPSGVDICCMFNSIIKGKPKLPKYLSSDNDPLFKYHRWRANLRILEIEEVKSVPYTPESHPFIERVFCSLRNELLDHTLFWGKNDLQTKLNNYKNYYNETRGHWSLGHLTPNQQSISQKKSKSETEPTDFYWQSHCSGLFQTPMEA
jgi:transposase InsO family protein